MRAARPEHPRAPRAQIPQGAAAGGVLLIDKPAGITSHDVVARVRRALGGVKTGHAGTLDPFATGLLIVLLGRATKSQAELMALNKRYVVTAALGVWVQKVSSALVLTHWPRMLWPAPGVRAMA